MIDSLSAHLATRPAINRSSDAAIRLLTGLRLSIMLRRRGRDPQPLLTDWLQSAGRAARMLHVIDVISHIWPERFVLSPPCCSTMSFDEALLAELVDCVGRAKPDHFHRAAHDLLSDDAREHLWRELTLQLAEV